MPDALLDVAGVRAGYDSTTVLHGVDLQVERGEFSVVIGPNGHGKTVAIGTVGQAYRFITTLSSVEWIEFRSLHADAVSSLQGAAGNAMLTVQATNALRALFARAKLL